MKYESSILKRLINTYGVVGNPRYISEIIKEFIVQGKERFPELFTYQADWLAHIDEFGLNPTYTVSYTGQSIYAPNTLERPVKSAILKGCTLVNIVCSKQRINYNYIDYNLSFIDKTKTYFIKFNALFEVTQIGFIVNESTWNINTFPEATNGYVKIKPNESTEITALRIRFDGNTDESVLPTLDLVCIEYQDGMENWDIPYFEGMKSVQMPVLTTSNEDGTKSNILTVNEDVTLRGIGDVKDELNLLTGELTQNIAEAVLSTFESYGASTSNGIYYMAKTKVTNDISPSHTLIIGVNKFISKIYSEVGGNFEIQVSSKEDGTYPTRAELSEYLSQNPLTLCYIPTTSTVKTVDLTILDQNGQNVKQLMSFKGGTHFNTRSSEGSPLPTVSVSVETDLEETLMVCSLEGNTM